ncbi:MAG: xanthine dehydrogenase family protein molybdopterin-binding subunit [Rhodobacter sp.]|uniref:xanthine dehydrogenase family protein molybdopterin-binding subunit n=1 Tax=Pararhodobacter sp. TaxID=2127056 RepID=UPI002CDB64B9|nr:xanthine dehydrogenase family protein molybdopterin-binding subunit [Pararhodobacter sp.]MCC0073447.1 xanthine dehydrogenase family protein molybdopterin-binding subunit [Rhodobacter sp.]HPD91438.1 xanthine dehydrogenase family protein molybdopterin-binding subunit [Pararhodobacter sp.]
MRAFGQSQGVKRREDLRFLTGTGRYVADTLPDGCLHAVFLRAPVAHATDLVLDVDAARQMPGIALVLTAGDLHAAGVTAGIWAVTARDQRGQRGIDTRRPILAEGTIRHVGEPLALIVAETREQGLDAAEAIEFDYTEHPAHLALEPGGPAVHAEAPDNVAMDWLLGDEDAVADAFARAAHVTRLSVRQNRVAVASLEPRACLAEWDGARLHFAFNGQGVWNLKRELARTLSLPEAAVQVTTPDVGGGFGMKSMGYPEHFAVAQASRALGRPVAWISDRAEAMVSDNGARDLESLAELAFDADLRLTGYRVTTRSNLGAYNSQFGQNIQSELFSKVLTGVYDIPCAVLRVQGLYSHTTPVDAYRGAGRPEAITLLERAMDSAARDLGVSPFDLRRRNFIAPDRFPYTTPGRMTYDVGDFARVLSRAEGLGDVSGFAARRKASESGGMLRGLGLCYYIESILGDDTEGATVEFADDGDVRLYVGTQSNGQGHETVYAQYLADLTGVPFERIAVIQGDSDRIATGGGTGGSRSVTVQSVATLGTVEQMVAAFAAFLESEGEPAPVTFEDGIFSAPGSNRRLTLLEAADLARARGRIDLLRHEKRTKLPGRSFPNGAHLCEVEVDPETGALRLDRYLAVDDLGTLMHPQLAEGQVHGGVAQGFGQAVVEDARFDPDGQLLTGSFMDYAMPRATDLPLIRFVSEPTPSRNNPIGMKGCGEAGTVGALAAIGNAALDALWSRGVRHVDMPLTPQRIWGWLQEAAA